jgi:hypothetical protein
MQRVMVVQVPARGEPNERERRPGPSTIATAAARFIEFCRPLQPEQLSRSNNPDPFLAPQIQQYKNHEVAFPDTRGLRQVSLPPVRNTCQCLRRARVWHSCFSAITNFS